MFKLLIALALAVFGAQCAPQLRPQPAPRHQSFSPNGLPAPRHQPFPPNGLPAQFAQPPRKTETAESEDYEIYQNQNAKYQFSSNIEDHINDLTNQRQEVREGGAVMGSYSYSDGYFKITVNYVADDDGYRVTSMEAVPLKGPQVDLKGTASVSSTAHGAQLRYRVASVPVPEPTEKFGNRNAQPFPSN